MASPVNYQFPAPPALSFQLDNSAATFTTPEKLLVNRNASTTPTTPSDQKLFSRGGGLGASGSVSSSSQTQLSQPKQPLELPSRLPVLNSLLIRIMLRIKRLGPQNSLLDHVGNAILLRLRSAYCPLTVSSIVYYFSPLVLYLVTFFVIAKHIPAEIRPTINVTTLPKIESLLKFPHRWFNQNPNIILDLLAAFPYTFHLVLPIVFSVILVLRSSPLRFMEFALTFGLMNVLATLTHLVNPMAPPWYFEKFGFQPANYSMPGDPALLYRVDQYFGNQNYYNMYVKGGSIVFGSWPSLHAAWPYLIAIFEPVIYFSRKFRSKEFKFSLSKFFFFYTAYVWWAALYLQHHFIVDVLAGALYAEIAYYLVGRLSSNDPEYLTGVPDDKDIASNMEAGTAPDSAIPAILLDDGES